MPFGHVGVPDLLKLFEPCTPRILLMRRLLMHPGTWFMRNVPAGGKRLRKPARVFAVELIGRRDGLELTV